MVRVTNKQDQATQIKYVDRIIQSEPNIIMSEPQIQYVDREVIKEIQVEGPERIVTPDQVIVHQETDLSPVYDAIEQIKHVINHNTKFHNEYLENLKTNLDMQSRALVALKQQRDIDRSRRLMLINRLKKERTAQRKFNRKLWIGFSILLTTSLITLIIK